MGFIQAFYSLGGHAGKRAHTRFVLKRGREFVNQAGLPAPMGVVHVEAVLRRCALDLTRGCTGI